MQKLNLHFNVIFFCQRKRLWCLFFFFNTNVSESQQFISDWMKHSKLTQSGLYVCSVSFTDKFLFWTKSLPLLLILQFGHWTEKSIHHLIWSWFHRQGTKAQRNWTFQASTGSLWQRGKLDQPFETYTNTIMLRSSFLSVPVYLQHFA